MYDPLKKMCLLNVFYVKVTQQHVLGDEALNWQAKHSTYLSKLSTTESENLALFKKTKSVNEKQGVRSHGMAKGTILEVTQCLLFCILSNYLIFRCVLFYINSTQQHYYFERRVNIICILLVKHTVLKTFSVSHRC